MTTVQPGRFYRAGIQPQHVQKQFGQNPAAALSQQWSQQVRALPPEMQPVVQTFGELVMQDSEAVNYAPRYPDNLKDIPRFPRPSHIDQEVMARNLADRLQKLGLTVTLDQHFNVIGTLKSNLPTRFPDKAKLPVVALKAHLDTTYEQPGKNIRPQLHRNYQGTRLVISEKNAKGEAVVLDPSDTPALMRRIGEDIITAGGDTLLGADAKAGVAEILDALRLLREHNLANPQKPLYHPEIKAVFTVDEETNLLGARALDLKKLGADVALDMDDTDPGRINVRSYNGHNVVVRIKARSVHTAELAHMRMASPMMLASKIATSLPANQMLENKKGSMKGYIYLDQMRANWHEGEMLFLVRDFDKENVKKRVATVIKTVEKVNREAQGTPATIQWQVEEEYQNPNINVRSAFVQHLVRSAKAVGVKPEITEFRGCTDGAIMTERGLPTVILGCGWQNAHQLTEWVSAQDLYRMSKNLLQIITDWPENGPRKADLDPPQPLKGMTWPTKIRSANWKE